MLLDYDTKDMPKEVKDKIAELGGFWEALCLVLPELRVAARVVRKSTSAGLRRADTGQEFPGSNGLHCYIVAKNGNDAERFLKTVHERCWLKGLGWMTVGAAGQLLERSIIDRAVYAPERLVFEGAPIVELPLEQDAEVGARSGRMGRWWTPSLRVLRSPGATLLSLTKTINRVCT